VVCVWNGTHFRDIMHESFMFTACGVVNLAACVSMLWTEQWVTHMPKHTHCTKQSLSHLPTSVSHIMASYVPKYTKFVSIRGTHKQSPLRYTPLSPLMPGGPLLPSLPGSPGKPIGPVSPLSPRGPGKPRGPTGPGTPGGPSGPCSPYIRQQQTL
jgi:hypothetical protein